MCILLNVKKHEKTFALNVDIFTKGVFLNFFLQSLELCDKTDYKRNVHQGCTTENA